MLGADVWRGFTFDCVIFFPIYSVYFSPGKCMSKFVTTLLQTYIKRFVLIVKSNYIGSLIIVLCRRMISRYGYGFMLLWCVFGNGDVHAMQFRGHSSSKD